MNVHLKVFVWGSRSTFITKSYLFFMLNWGQQNVVRPGFSIFNPPGLSGAVALRLSPSSHDFTLLLNVFTCVFLLEIKTISNVCLATDQEIIECFIEKMTFCLHFPSFL